MIVSHYASKVPDMTLGHNYVHNMIYSIHCVCSRYVPLVTPNKYVAYPNFLSTQLLCMCFLCILWLTYSKWMIFQQNFMIKNRKQVTHT